VKVARRDMRTAFAANANSFNPRATGEGRATIASDGVTHEIMVFQSTRDR